MGEPTGGLPSPNTKSVSPMSSRMTSPTAAKPSAPEQGVVVLVTTLMHGLNDGLALRRQAACSVNSTAFAGPPATGCQLIVA